MNKLNLAGFLNGDAQKALLPSGLLVLGLTNDHRTPAGGCYRAALAAICQDKGSCYCHPSAQSTPFVLQDLDWARGASKFG